MSTSPNAWVGPIGLYGASVRLEPATMAHLRGLFEASRDPSIWTYMLAEQPKNIGSMTSYVEAALAEVDLGRRVCFTIFRSTDGIIVGSTSLFDFSFPDRRLEIGHTWLSPSAQRTAINTECKLLLLQYAFEALGCVRVQLKTDVRNARSRRAIERIGGAFEGTLRKLQTRYDGYVRDTAIYSITSDDWHVVLANLIGHLARR